MAYDITIDSPSTGGLVNSPFTATGEVTSDDGLPFDYTVICTLTDFMTAERYITATPTGPGTWSADLTDNPGTYTLTANLYVNPTSPLPANSDANDSISDLTIGAAPPPIWIIGLDDPPPPPPGPPAPMLAAVTPATQPIGVRGTYDPASGVASITCVVTGAQGADKKGGGEKHQRVVAALHFAASEFNVTMDAPAKGRFAIEAMAFAADGTLLGSSTWNHTRK